MAGDARYSELTFIGRDSGLSRVVGRPLKRFLQVQAAGGVVLLIATIIALVWANSPFKDSYYDFWHVHIDLHLGDWEIFDDTLVHFVNDALMAIFFFVVGLEIKRELTTGALRDLRDAVLPAVAALGGMVVPALIYVALNLGGEGANGWGIAMATDIAFAIGVLSLLGDSVPRILKVFLLTLAIVDDIGAIIVIAIFYPSEKGISLTFLALAAVSAALIYFMRSLRVWYIPIYIVAGTIFWWLTFKSGVHATIAGVVLGLLTPAIPLQTKDDARKFAEWLRDKEEVYLVDIQYADFHIRESVSVAERLERHLHPITSYIIIPVFALANAGVELSGGKISGAFSSRVTWGIILGLVVGKTVGITGFSLLARQLGLVTFPRALTVPRLVGLAMVAGIGFTVSLFVAGLAFDSGASVVDEAKIGILIASVIAGVAGAILLKSALREAPAD